MYRKGMDLLKENNSSGFCCLQFREEQRIWHALETECRVSRTRFALLPSLRNRYRGSGIAELRRK